jgi:uncharacterized protein YdhG (YjbR/CyaY superfamily)
MKKSRSRPAKTKPANSSDTKAVANYYARLSEPAKSTLQKVRAAILSACPKATIETISYGIPTFKHNGGIVAIAAFKDHCSLFPMSYFVIDKFRTELSRFEVSKGTVRFPVDKPLSATLLKKIVKARLAQMAEKQKPNPLASQHQPFSTCNSQLKKPVILKRPKDAEGSQPRGLAPTQPPKRPKNPMEQMPIRDRLYHVYTSARIYCRGGCP